MRTCALLLAAGLLVPASVRADEAVVLPKNTGRSLVLLGPSGPVLFRLHLMLDGQPVTPDHMPWAAKLFALLDRNEDGKLDKDETARVPRPQILTQLRYGGYLTVLAPNSMATLAELDTADKDGTVSLEELSAFYARGGMGRVFVSAGGGTAYPAAAITDELFKYLDRNKDGNLAQDEVTAGAAALARLDQDDDEMIALTEIVGNPYGSGYGVPIQTRSGMAGPVSATNLILPFDLVDLTPQTVNQLINAYDKDRNQKLDRQEANLSKAVFDGLDSNRDDLLDASELIRFGDRPTDLEFVVRLGKRGEGEAGTDFCGPNQKALPLPKDIRRADADGLAITLSDAVLELRRQDGSQAANYLRMAQSFKQQFQVVDANKDGTLDEKELQDRRAQYMFRPMLLLADRDGDGKLKQEEFDAYFAMQDELVGSFLMMQVRDNSQGLFEMLDANRDNRIGVRELRTAWSRMKNWDRDGDGQLARSEIPRQVQLVVSQGRAGYNAGPRTPVVVRAGSNTVTRPTSASPGGPVWFRKMDRNSDGDVSRREFLGSLEDFRRIDVDGDELIDLNEAKAADKGLRQADAKR
jgi:Ca2+-binding EF-hand superfamily protein